jgi:hypothetical protein
MDFLSSGLNAITDAVKTTVGKVDDLLPGRAKLKEETMSPGTVYLKFVTPEPSGCVVAQLAPYGTVPTAASEVTFVLANPSTAATFHEETSQYKAEVKNAANLEGAIVVCKRGAISVIEKVVLVDKSKGAACIIIETSDDPLGKSWPIATNNGRPEPLATELLKIPCARVRASDGKIMLRRLKSTPVKLSGYISPLVSAQTFSPAVAEDIYSAYDFRVPLPTEASNSVTNSLLTSLTWEIADELPGRVADTPAMWCGYRHIVCARRSQQLTSFVENMVVYIFKLCELFSSTLCEGINHARFFARVRRTVLAIGEQNMLDVEALTFLDVTKLLCKRPWCQLFPYTVRKQLKNSQNFISVVQKLQSSMKKGTKKASKMAADAAALDAGEQDAEKALSPVEQFQAMRLATAKAGRGPKDIYERVLALSNHPENVPCVDCETQVNFPHRSTHTLTRLALLRRDHTKPS